MLRIGIFSVDECAAVDKAISTSTRRPQTEV
jgi:hypothetical protein